jgi:integrase
LKSFLADDKRDALLREAGKVGLWMRAPAAKFGFRRGELVNLKVKALDLAAGTLRLEATETTTAKARIVKLTPDVLVLLQACCVGKGPDALVFTREDGKPLGSFKKVWARITKAAGCPELLFHNLRRSAARNMVRAGIPERVAMSISGHRTRSIVDRYHIVPEQDINEAADRIAAANLKNYRTATGERQPAARNTLNQALLLDFIGGPAWIRTRDQGIMSPAARVCNALPS